MDVPLLPPVSNEHADESTSGILTYSEHHVDSPSKDDFLEKDDNSIDWDRERGRGQISNAWYGRGLQWFNAFQLRYRDDFTFSSSTSQGRAKNLFLFLVSWLKYGLIFLRPSFVTNIWKKKHINPKRIPPTAYLNGLRGVAAFCVFCQHYLTCYYGGELLWGYHAKPEAVWMVQLPFIRLTYSGGFMVCLFFVLSGFVLSYKPLQYCRSHDDASSIALLKSLASSVFRRGARLFMPCIPPLIFAAICVHYGLYGVDQHPLEDIVVAGHPTIWGDLSDAFRYFERLLNFYDATQFFPPTIPPLYTLPVEFRGSITVFILALGLSQAKPVLRMTTFACLCWYTMYHGVWEMFLFIAGMILAELRLIRNEATLDLGTSTLKPELSTLKRNAINLFWIFNFFIALFLGSFPILGSASSPGYQTLSLITPSNFQGDYSRMFFWSSLAAIQLLLCLENFPVLQLPFASSFILYLGDISFSLYILHIPMMMTVGRNITMWLVEWSGDKEVGFCLGWLALVPILFWVSDVQWRLFDENSVRFARWLAVKVFAV